MANNPNQPRRTAGENPRTTRIREIVFRAAVSLLLDEGAEAVTALRVSEHTGIARSTIYRHWPDQHTLLLDTIDRIVTHHLPISITENVQEDLTVALSNLRKRMTTRPFRVIFSTLLDHANRDRVFVAVQQRFVSGVLQPIHDILTAATQRGDLPSTVDIDEATAQLAGPLFTQHIMLRTSMSDGLIARTVSQFLAPYTTTTEAWDTNPG